MNKYTFCLILNIALFFYDGLSAEKIKELMPEANDSIINIANQIYKQLNIMGVKNEREDIY